MFFEKYSPKSSRDLSNLPAVSEIKKWLASWKRGRALLVHGPTGCGKSVALKLIASELGYEPIDACGFFDTSDEERTRQGKNLIHASAQRGIFSKKNLIVLEDIDTMSPRGLSQLLSQLVKASYHPVICTAADAYQLSSGVRKIFKPVRFSKVSDAHMIAMLEEICKNEKINAAHRDLEQLAKTSNGDVRSLLIDFDTFHPNFRHAGFRNIDDSIFNTLKVIFKSTSIENAKIAVENSEKDPEELFRWIEQNITEEYNDPKVIAAAYDCLSKADLFYSRIIRRQSWALQKYFSNISVYGTSLAKDRPSVRFASYRPPVFIRRSSGLDKIANNLHISKRRAQAYVPILRMLAKRNSALFEELGMDDKEINAITG